MNGKGEDKSLVIKISQYKTDRAFRKKITNTPNKTWIPHIFTALFSASHWKAIQPLQYCSGIIVAKFCSDPANIFVVSSIQGKRGAEWEPLLEEMTGKMVCYVNVLGKFHRIW